MLKNPKRKKIIRIILAAIVLVAAVIVFFNTGKLSRSPFDSSMFMDEPLVFVQNSNGNSAVLDCAGSRVFILSPDDEITNIITYNSMSDVTPTLATDLAIDNNYLYILDHFTGVNGTTIIGDKVLVYNINGKFEKSLIDTDTMTDGDYSLRIRSLEAYDEKLYATVYDSSDPQTLIVSEITDGSLNILEDSLIDEGYLYSDYAPDGSLIVLDRNSNTISRYKDGSEQILSETWAKSFYINNDTLMFADPVTYYLGRINLTSGNETVLQSLSLCNSIMFWTVLTWVMLILGSVALLLLLISFAIDLIKKHKAKNTADAEKKEKPMTIGSLFGPMFLIFVFVFGVTALFFGTFYFDNMFSARQTEVINAAYGIRETSSISIGDSLKEINSKDDFGSEAYEMVDSFVSSILMSNLNVEGSLNLTYKIYRTIDGSDSIMVVKDQTGKSSIGEIVTIEEQMAAAIDSNIASAKEKQMNYGEQTYQNGAVIFQVYAPVYDSDGNVVGIVVPMLNETLVASQIRNNIFNKLLEIFTLLAGLVMLLAEIRYLLKVSKIQKERHKHAIKDTTVFEASHTLELFVRIPGAILIVFVTLITSNILADSGVNNTILLALPLTINSIAFSIVRTTMGPIVKYNPKRNLLTGIGISTFSVILIGIAILFNSFVIIVIGSGLFGVGSAWMQVSVKPVTLSTEVHDERFKFILLSKSESAIASAIGASLGAVIRSAFGDMALLLFVFVLCVAIVPLGLYFVGSDLNIPKAQVTAEVANKPSMVEKLKKSGKFYFIPSVAVILLCGYLPINFIIGLSDYVLPLFNQSMGLNDVYIGVIILIIKLIAIFITPLIIKEILTGRRGTNFWIILFMALLAVFFAVFGITTEMKTFIPLLIVVTIVYTTISALARQTNIKLAKQANLNPTDTDVGFEIVSNLGNALQSIVFSLLLIQGFSFMGYVWAIICGVFVAAALLVILKTKKSSDKLA